MFGPLMDSHTYKGVDVMMFVKEREEEEEEEGAGLMFEF